MDDKIVRIACQGAADISIDELIEFQGSLKSLSDDAYKKLRTSILDLGFSFPIFAWKNGEKTMVIDAHQRITALKKMRDEEGYTIPRLPVAWIEASNEKEAGRKLLAATSQYGEITPDGLRSFMSRFDLNMVDLSLFKFPEIDIPSFELTFFPETAQVSFEARKEWKGMPEYDHQDKQAFRSIVVHFFDQAGVDRFAELMAQGVTEKTRMMWYPEIVIEKAADKRYGNFEVEVPVVNPPT